MVTASGCGADTGNPTPMGRTHIIACAYSSQTRNGVPVPKGLEKNQKKRKISLGSRGGWLKGVLQGPQIRRQPSLALLRLPQAKPSRPVTGSEGLAPRSPRPCPSGLGGKARRPGCGRRDSARPPCFLILPPSPAEGPPFTRRLRRGPCNSAQQEVGTCPMEM